MDLGWILVDLGGSWWILVDLGGSWWILVDLGWILGGSWVDLGLYTSEAADDSTYVDFGGSRHTQT